MVLTLKRLYFPDVKSRDRSHVRRFDANRDRPDDVLGADLPLFVESRIPATPSRW